MSQQTNPAKYFSTTQLLTLYYIYTKKIEEGDSGTTSVPYCDTISLYLKAEAIYLLLLWIQNKEQFDASGETY